MCCRNDPLWEGASAKRAGEINALFCATDTIAIGVHPAGIGEQLLCICQIVFNLTLGIIPGHAVILGVSRNTIAVKSLFTNSLTVNTIGESFTTGDVAGEIIANGIAVFVFFILSGSIRHCNTKVVDSFFLQQIVAVYRIVSGHNGGGQGNINLAGLNRHQTGVLIGHLDEHHPADSGSGAVVMFIGFEDKLLIHIVLNQLVGAGGNGIKSKVFTIG